MPGARCTPQPVCKGRKHTVVTAPSLQGSPFVTNTYDTLGRIATQANANGAQWDYFFAGYRSEEDDPFGQCFTAANEAIECQPQVPLTRTAQPDAAVERRIGKRPRASACGHGCFAGTACPLRELVQLPEMPADRGKQSNGSYQQRSLATVPEPDDSAQHNDQQGRDHPEREQGEQPLSGRYRDALREHVS